MYLVHKLNDLKREAAIESAVTDKILTNSLFIITESKYLVKWLVFLSKKFFHFSFALITVYPEFDHLTNVQLLFLLLSVPINYYVKRYMNIFLINEIDVYIHKQMSLCVLLSVYYKSQFDLNVFLLLFYFRVINYALVLSYFGTSCVCAQWMTSVGSRWKCCK